MLSSKALFAAVAFGAATLPALAQSATLYERTFLEKYRGSDCYGREYGPAQWKRNPNLKIFTIAIRSRPKTISTLAKSTSRLFGVELAVTTRSQSEYRALGDCKPAGAVFKCTLESDGGDFKLIRVGRDLRLETRRIQIEGFPTDLAIQSTRKGPTRSFTLDGGAAAPCDLD